MRLEPKTDEYIPADRTAAVVRLDRVRERVRAEVCADASLDEAEQGEVAINQVVYAEVAVGFASREQLERALQGAVPSPRCVWTKSFGVPRTVRVP